MSSVEGSGFFQDVAAFASNHKIFCISTLGLALVGYSIGNLAGRAVSWICKCVGTTKKTNDVGLENIPTNSPKKNEMFFKNNYNTEQNSVLNLNNANAPDVNTDLIEKALSLPIQNLLTAYKTPEAGWVMVPPKDEMQTDQRFAIASGAIAFSGNGRWKIHVSIHPNQMEQAIPIFMEVLHSPDAPRLGFKMQTKTNLDSVHQIGKEFALIFDKKVEAAALEGHREVVERCLSILWKKLYDAGIRPEPGVVLTPQTMETVRTAPAGSQIQEKKNLKMGKFDRAIPCPKDCNFFYYRDENFAPICDNEIEGLRSIPGVYAASDIIELARQQPDFAHNPTQSPDPFLNLQIQER